MAEADLAEIWNSLAIGASETIATRFVHAIEASFERIRHFPRSGPARPSFGDGLRVTFYRSYAAYYVIHPGSIVIVRVIHGARDAAAIAERDGFRIEPPLPD